MAQDANFRFPYCLEVRNPETGNFEPTSFRGTTLNIDGSNVLVGFEPGELTLLHLSEDSSDYTVIAEHVSEYHYFNDIYVICSKRQWMLKFDNSADSIPFGKVGDELLTFGIFVIDELPKIAVCLMQKETDKAITLVFDVSSRELEYTLYAVSKIVEDRYLVYFNYDKGGWLLDRGLGAEAEILGEVVSFDEGIDFYKAINAEMHKVLRIEPNLEETYEYSEYGVFRDVMEDFYLIVTRSDGFYDFFDVDGEKLAPVMGSLKNHYKRFETYASETDAHPENVKIFKWDADVQGFKILYDGKDMAYFYNAVVIPLNVVLDVKLINLDTNTEVYEGHWGVRIEEQTEAYAVKIESKIWYPVDASDPELCRFLDFR